MANIVIENAKLSDVEAMKEVLDVWAKRGLLLSRSRLDMYENIRDFTVAKDDGVVVGLAGLHILWFDLVEIRSLAVLEERQGEGIGRLLVERALEDAKELGIKRVFSLTYKPGFFEKLGFSEVEKSELPHKVWMDCLNCTQFPDCAEIAMTREV